MEDLVESFIQKAGFVKDVNYFKEMDNKHYTYTSENAIPGAVPHPLDLPKGCKFAPRCKYCTQKCIDQEPELMQVDENQWVRCFYANKAERRSAEHEEIVVHQEP